MTIRQHAVLPAAEIDCQLLAAHGIRAHLDNVGLSTVHPLLAGAAGAIQLQVDASLVLRAEAILATEQQPLPTPTDSTDNDTNDNEEPSTASTDESPHPTCPDCGSEMITTIRPFLLVVWFIPILFPLLFITRRHCDDCGTTSRLWAGTKQ